MSLVFGIAVKVQNKDDLLNLLAIIILHVYLQLFAENIMKWLKNSF
jgi:hypothetical protein